MKKLNPNISVITFLITLSLILSTIYTLTTITKTTQEPSQQLESFTYEITFTDESGYYGESSLGYGVYFTNDNLQPNQTIQKGDQVKAWFPVNDYETIVKVEKLNKNELAQN
ncbi:hypothetical protein [Bacillus sp. T33-2]|uniref:hypothetical protein n=1 Tax=Bacillus sp. T33-2 TaxID=2054168 RepID=UPI000C782F32|nr:hypothetical protein [Bacillus sp. T33-2]PLR99619.1 hypothetical protein CVD19_00725 [Bacillus sp. T33-2]